MRRHELVRVRLSDPTLAGDIIMNQRLRVGGECGYLSSNCCSDALQLGELLVEVRDDILLFRSWWKWNQHTAIPSRIQIRLLHGRNCQFSSEVKESATVKYVV